MEISKLFVQARSATVQIADDGLYHTKVACLLEGCNLVLIEC